MLIIIIKDLYEIREAQNLDIFRHENDKIGVVLSKMGQERNLKNILRFSGYMLKMINLFISI